MLFSALSQTIVFQSFCFIFVLVFIFVVLFRFLSVIIFQFCTAIFPLKLLSVYISDFGLPSFPFHFGVILLFTLALSKVVVASPGVTPLSPSLLLS